MTIVHDDGDAAPGLHALLIGVDTYPHLKGGKKKLFKDHEEMGQLGSPRHSVQLVGEWLYDSSKIVDMPVRSIDVLMSTSPKSFKWGKKKVKVDRASAQNVAASVLGWQARGNADPNNLLVLYYCGHGVSWGEKQSLLLEDFGGNVFDPFTDAVAIDETIDGMRRCAATRQLYFLDACRSVSEDYLRNLGNKGIRIIDAAAHSRLGIVRQHVFHAAENGLQAFGKDGEPSIFAQSLVRALSGPAASPNDDGGWEIKASGIYAALDKLMPLVEPTAIQVANARLSENFSLFKLLAAPQVPVSVYCKPEHFTQTATLSCWKQGAQLRRRHPPRATNWDLELPHGDYEFRASLGQGVPEKSRNVTVFPPLTNVAISCP